MATLITNTGLLEALIELRPKIERVITRRVGSRDTAADLAQDLFFRLDRVTERLPTRDDARRYLMRMAVNAATDHLRVEGRRVQLLEGAVSLFEGEVANPENEALTDEQLRDVEAALAELPAKCRAVLYLSRVEGLTHAEIAARLKVSKSLVEKYAVRALLHCRARLKRFAAK